MSDDPSSHAAPKDDESVWPAGESGSAQSVPDSPHGVTAGAGSKMPPAAAARAVDRQKTVISKRPPVSAPAFSRAANPFEMGEALEGEQLGHFQLEEFVGGGGMGVVFRATDIMLGRTVAVKVVSRDQTNEDTLRRFKNEAQSAARLDHPNIARVYYVGEDKGWNYIVFEYIEGVNVRDLVEHNGPLALEDAISFTLQIAEALEHASQREVTHRDIKPSNILIMIDGRAKLVDMGLARLQQVESSTDDLTASGVTLGTFDYISPEQARDPRNTDVRSDLYSLGCTLFFMLTGQPPFPDGTVLQKLLSHSSDEPPELIEYRGDVDEEVAAVVRRLLAKLPDQRYPSPRELIGALLLLADRLELPGIRASSTYLVTPNEQKLPWWARHLPWSVPVVLLIAFALVYRWADSRADPPMVSIPRLAATVDPDDAATRSDSGEKEDSLRKAGLEQPMAPNGATLSDPTVEEPSAAENDAARGATDNSRRELDVKPPSQSQSPRDISAATNDQPTGSTPNEPLVGPGESVSDEQRSDIGALSDQSDQRSTGAVAAGLDRQPDRPGAIPADTPRIIVVTDEAIASGENALAVPSLEAAIGEAAKLQTIAEIQLRFDGVRLQQPIALDARRFPDGRLTIRAADGYSPVLAFRPRDETRAAAMDHSMIQILGGHVSWLGTQFYLELPVSTGDRENWSLFRLGTINRLEFRQCTFTIRNVDSEGLPSSRSVSFLELIGSGEFGGLLLQSTPLAGDTPEILLEDCIARGQAPFVRAEFAIPFSFSWEHGLFVSTQRLVDVGGMIVEPQWEHGGVRVFLRRLLSVADRGICLVRSDNVAPYPLGLVAINCEDCLFATQTTLPPTPLYVLRTTSAFSRGTVPLAISGRNNYYKNTKVVLRVETNGDRNAFEQYTFDDLKGPDIATWFSEKSPQPATIFYWAPPLQSVDRQSMHDFIPPGIGDGWFTRALGIAPSQLPRLPDLDLMPLPDELPAGASAESGRRLLDPQADVVPDAAFY